jgi:hypothetical protein
METNNLIADLVNNEINRTKGKFFTVVFTKKDGTTRQMTCRIGVKKGVNGNGLKFEPKEKGLRVVWSADAEGYRMINLATVKQFKFKNTRIFYS